MPKATRPGPKQQPDDAGDMVAQRGSTASDGYWTHDEFGPRTYVPVNATDGAPLEEKFARMLANFPDIAEGQVSVREAEGVVWLEGSVTEARQATALEAALGLVSGGRPVRNLLLVQS